MAFEAKPNVMVFMPHARDVKPATVNSLCNLLMYCMTKDMRIALFNPHNSSNIAATRQKALGLAIKGGFSHILMLDDDMVFPRQTLEVLLSHDKDIVCCNYITKNQYKPRWVANTEEGGIDSSKSVEPLQEVRGSGMGVTLIRCAAVKDIPKPWFQMLYRGDREDGSEDWLAEDFHFFIKAKEFGLKVYCDNDLSKDVYHVGDFFYSGFRTVPPSMEE